MSLNDVILDHESNQCLFVCTKCGAEYVTRDMLAMHMMDSARAGMCIDSEAINNASTLNKNNSNQKITVCEVLVDSDQACTQKSETSNVFESTHPYASLSNWIGERAEPIFNMLFNQLTLPHIYSLQSPTVNVNTKNNMDSNVFDPVDRKVFSSLEDNIPCVRGLQSNRNTSSSLLDIQKNDGIQCLLMNCKQQANNDSTNIKMNFISSLKGNKNDVFTSSTTLDWLRMTSEKSIPNVNDCEGSAKGNLNEFLFNQTCTLPVYSLIRSLPNYNTSSTASTNNSQAVNSPTVSESVNDNSKATTNSQCISQRVIKEVHSEEYFKNATVDPQPARYNDLKSLKFHKTFVDFKDCYTTKRSRSLPSPRALRNHQASCEIKTVHGNDVNKLTKISGLKNDDEVLHKIRYDRKCSKKTAYRNIRKIMSYNRSKFSVSQNQHNKSQTSNCHHLGKIRMHSEQTNNGQISTDIQHTSRQGSNIAQTNNQKMNTNGHLQPIFPYVCEYCQIGFVQQALFCLHMGMHCVNNPLKCNMCAHTCLDVYDFISHTLHF